MELFEKFIREALENRIKTPLELHRLKNTYCEQYKLQKILNIDLIDSYKKLLNKKSIQEDALFFKLITKRNVRTLSGVSVITVLTKPYDCPGTCIFCPTEPDMPKSYLSNEPAVQRAVLNQWDGFKQVHNRLRSLQITGHAIEKNELIIAGGTWSYYPKQYQTAFIKSCFDGCNTYEEVSKHITYTSKNSKLYAQFETTPVTVNKANTLTEAKKRNETAFCRIIGLSLETRPDYVTQEEVIRMRKLGCTRVQLGVQTVYDDILKMNKRGHGVKESIEATKLLKDAGLKVDYHMMPNLYGSTKKKDVEMFRILFTQNDFQPDQLKIYPCSVVYYAQLEKLFRQGKYIPYSEQELEKILYEIKTKHIPPYVRISRLIRDIPSTSILEGSKRTNLRQIIQQKMEQQGEKCHCIRCREVGGKDMEKMNPELVIREYDASGGKEIFLSFEDVKQDIIFGFCRLRIPSQFFTKEKHFIKELQDSSIIRELHVYGLQVPIDTKKDQAVQHYGFGKKLMVEAEKYTKKMGIKKIAVTSGVGVREYYKKLGYKKKGEYMVKKV